MEKNFQEIYEKMEAGTVPSGSSRRNTELESRYEQMLRDDPTEIALREQAEQSKKIRNQVFLVVDWTNRKVKSAVRNKNRAVQIKQSLQEQRLDLSVIQIEIVE